MKGLQVFSNEQRIRTRSQTKITPTGRQTIWRRLAREGYV